MITELSPLLDASGVTPAFRADVESFARTGAADRIAVPRHNPHVKVLRLLAQLVHAEPTLAVDRVEIEGRAGCSDYTGSLRAITADGETLHFDFKWCCAWRAQQQGWIDDWGLADQMRAAHEFGWDCFERWHARGLVEA